MHLCAVVFVIMIYFLARSVIKTCEEYCYISLWYFEFVRPLTQSLLNVHVICENVQLPK